MEQVWDKIIKVLSAVGCAIAGIFGEWNMILTVLCVVMVIDYVSGVMVAIANKSRKSDNGGLSSKAGFIGILKKGMILLVVLLATLLDKALGTDQFVFQLACAGFYIANEGLSVLENAVVLGLPVPDKLKDVLEEMKNEKKEPNEVKTK